MTAAYNYIKENKLGLEKDYPYKGRNNKCTKKD